jgi:tetratricopeptide (TPR) repeat protein
LTSIGNVHFRNGDYDKALEYYSQALEIEKENNNLFGQARALHDMGLTYLRKENYREALLTAESALEIADQLGAVPILEVIYKTLADLYYTTGDIKRAYESIILFEQMRDLQFNEATSRKLAELDVAYEFERLEKEIEELRQENEINSLRAENSRVVILVGIMGTLLIIGALFVYYASRKRTKKKPIV